MANGMSEGEKRQRVLTIVVGTVVLVYLLDNVDEIMEMERDD